jgi:hypothetical protein
MDFSIPTLFSAEIERLKKFLKEKVKPELSAWYQNREIPVQFFRDMGAVNCYGI